MIAVLDITKRGDWRFVRNLHHLGYAISWVVEEDMKFGIDSISTDFRGCMHRVGFDDEQQLQTSIAGCDCLMILVSKDTPPETIAPITELALRKANADIELFQVKLDGQVYEIEKLQADNARESRTPKVELTNLVSHVG